MLDLIHAIANQWYNNDTTKLDCEELLQSLKLREATSRFDQVEQACSQTFEWLFEEPEVGFRSWLESGKGLYWCRGYPASGKSTLMKWVFNDTRTAAALSSQDVRKARVNFFFHERGSEMQKSFKGLLQGIMYQILQESRELLQSILPIRQEILRRLRPSWTEEDIKRAFQCILGQQVLRLDIMLFLDALDEYNGNYEKFASFLHSIVAADDTSLTRLKIFFSSRPLQVFLDKFRNVPGFDIHAHTVEDINLVIHSKMSQNSRMSQYMQAEDRLLTIEFANKISSKAQGIFLWVVLVLDELLEEFTEGESVRGLMRKLDCLPPKLEDFYHHTLNRLPSKYLNDNMLIFEVLGCAMNPLELHDLFEICRCAQMPSLAECTPCTAADNVYDNDSLQRWVRSRTAGLVQLVPSKNNETGETSNNTFCPVPYRRGETIYIVQFLHQTVKTFNSSARRATGLTNRYSPHENDNGHFYIARYILALLFHHPQQDPRFLIRSDPGSSKGDALKEQNFWGKSRAFHVIGDLGQYVGLAESKTPKVLLPSFVEFGDDRIRNLFDNTMWKPKLRYALTSVLAYAVVYRFCDLLDALLEQSKGKAMHSSPPLLHLAITQPKPYSRIGFIVGKKRSEVIRILLNHGANACEVFEEHTAYERVCDIAIQRRHYLVERSEGLLAKVLPFLEAGQANVKIKYSKRISKRFYRWGEQCLLHYAAASTDTGLITALLEHGADVNAVDEDGSTPLDWLCDGTGDLSSDQLSEIVDKFLQEPASSRQNGRLVNYLEAASILISKGARYGVPTAAADDLLYVGFSDFVGSSDPVARQSVTQAHINGLKSRGIGT